MPGIQAGATAAGLWEVPGSPCCLGQGSVVSRVLRLLGSDTSPPALSAFSTRLSVYVSAIRGPWFSS